MCPSLVVPPTTRMFLEAELSRAQCRRGQAGLGATAMNSEGPEHSRPPSQAPGPESDDEAE